MIELMLWFFLFLTLFSSYSSNSFVYYLILSFLWCFFTSSARQPRHNALKYWLTCFSLGFNQVWFNKTVEMKCCTRVFTLELPNLFWAKKKINKNKISHRLPFSVVFVLIINHAFLMCVDYFLPGLVRPWLEPGNTEDNIPLKSRMVWPVMLGSCSISNVLGHAFD